MRAWRRPSSWSAPSATSTAECRSRTHTGARWSTPGCAISSSAWTSAKAGPATGTPCARCACWIGTSVGVSVLFGTARTRDGLQLRTLRWPAAGVARAHLLLIHGIAEHAGRHGHVASRLASAGIETYAFDLRGFGASEGPRAYAHRWARSHDDVEDRLTPLPTYVLHGGDGPVVPVSSSAWLARRENVTRRVYPRLRHEMHNEPEADAVIGDTIAWLERSLVKP